VPWDPAQYLKFADHRLRPAVDLLNRIDVANPAEVYDLGAGAGNVTRLLKERWPNARIIGVDESDDMLAKAATGAPEIAWQRADLATWSPAHPADVIYSNAALHWLSDHDRLFPALFSALAALGLSLAGIAAAYALWGRPSTVPAEARGRFPWAARALEQKLYFDDVYQTAFYEPSTRTAVAVTQFVEEPLVLRSLRGLGDGVRVFGSRVAAAQTGLVRSYALALAGGLALLAVVFLVVSA